MKFLRRQKASIRSLSRIYCLKRCLILCSFPFSPVLHLKDSKLPISIGTTTQRPLIQRFGSDYWSGSLFSVKLHNVSKWEHNWDRKARIISHVHPVGPKDSSAQLSEGSLNTKIWLESSWSTSFWTLKEKCCNAIGSQSIWMKLSDKGVSWDRWWRICGSNLEILNGRHTVDLKSYWLLHFVASFCRDERNEQICPHNDG